METITKIGCTEISKHPEAKVMYYISTLNESGRDEQYGHTESREEIDKLWANEKIDGYDAHLYVALVVDKGDDGYELIDDEVIDCHVIEE